MIGYSPLIRQPGWFGQAVPCDEPPGRGTLQNYPVCLDGRVGMRWLRGEPLSFMDYLRTDPAADADFEIERRPDLPREIDLAVLNPFEPV